MTKAAKKKPLTAAEVRERLAVKFAAPEWVLLNEVRNSTGWAGDRSADCLALATWPSRGVQIYGFEIKSSRADVLKELREPQKADAIKKYCDRWYLVLGRADLIKDSEVPANWGLIVPHGLGLRIAQESKLNEAKPWPREFVASMLRNAHQNTLGDAELRKEYLRGTKEGREQRNYVAKRDAEDLQKLRAKVAKFEEISGVTVLGDRYAWEGKLRAEAAQIRAIMTSGTGTYFEDMARLILQMETLSRQVREQLVTQGALPAKASLDDPCPHPKRHGRHEVYLQRIEKKKKRGQPKPVQLVYCRACGAEGEQA